MNQENIKQKNRSEILRLLCREGAMSRKDIAGIMGLTPAAVTLICSDMIADGLIQETGAAEEEKRAGRKKILVDINYSYAQVLCIAIESDESYITVTDLRGTIQNQKTMQTDSAIEPEAFLKKVAAESLNLISGETKLLGAAVSIPGTVDRVAGTTIGPNGIWEKSVAVKGLLEQMLECSVVLENNVKAFAQGEITYGIGKITNNLMFVKWGPGVGSAVTINHQVYQGREFRGAEIGHYIVNKQGQKCRCGKTGCLETEISTHAIVGAVEQAYTPGSMPKLAEWLKPTGHSLGAKSIDQWANVQDDALQDIIDDRIDLLALTTENVVSILNPDKVIVYGKLFDIDRVFQRFESRCQGYDPGLEANYIVKSDLSDKIEYIGPLAVAMSEFYF